MKPFYTYEQQIEKLKNANLIIEDENQAIDYLKFDGYYNIINGYSFIFKNEKDKYLRGTTFSDIKTLYDFDKSLRNIIYKYASSIECHIKAIVAHEFSRNHGVDEKLYLSPESFAQNPKNAEAVSRLIKECNSTIEDARNKNSNKYRSYVEHNLRVNGHVPMWVLVRALSFGTVSILYKLLCEPEKYEISQIYELTPKQLSNALEVVVSFRNIVAHGERTFCAKLPKTRLSTTFGVIPKMSIAKNANGENKFGKNDFLALMICFKYLLQPIEFSGFMTETEILFDSLSENLSPDLIGKIRTEMGLKGNGWKLLPKLKK